MSAKRDQAKLGSDIALLVDLPDGENLFDRAVILCLEVLGEATK
jgi:predicted nucleotidyltransferase